MGFLDRLKRLARFLAARAYAALPVDGLTKPIFILGCGRSGTTIFGTALSKHPRITYLNEPRHLWQAAFPQTDIWTRRAAARGGKLVFTAADAERRRSEMLRRLFRFETALSRKPLLIEKLPINSFRLELIHEIFPDARFLHVHRNGLEVARSIARMCESGPWFGTDSYKWGQLAQHAASRKETESLPALCSNFLQKGLLEWRLGTEAIVSFLRQLPEQSYFEISYDELVQDPQNTMTRVLTFAGLPVDAAVLQFVRDNIRRQSAELKPHELSERECQIGGPLLPLSMNRLSLTKRAA